VDKTVGYVEPAQPSPSPHSVECREIAIWAEPETSLTAQAYRNLTERGLGSPALHIVRAGNVNEGEEECLIFRHAHRPPGNFGWDEVLIFHRTGALILQRHLVTEGARHDWFDADEWLREIVDFSLRGANLLSLVPATQFIHFDISISGVRGSSLIFNPPRETFRAICRYTGPIGREESIQVQARAALINALENVLHNVANDVLNKFEAENPSQFSPRVSPFGHISREELSQVFAESLAGLRFESGVLSEVTNSEKEMSLPG
jgi:hypothetical protein